MFILEADTKRLLLVSGPPSPLTEGLDASKKYLSEKSSKTREALVICLPLHIVNLYVWGECTLSATRGKDGIELSSYLFPFSSGRWSVREGCICKSLVFYKTHGDMLFV